MSYEDVCWFFGIMPTGERIWLEALQLLIRLSKATTVPEQQALDCETDILGCPQHSWNDHSDYLYT